jgi:AcrR family transcriptional regulator
MVDDAPAELGRRDRKKLETRLALVHAALDLFEANGVAATTVLEISDRVDVSPRTFHRYFAAKEDVLFADAAERLERFQSVLAARPTDEPLLDSLAAAAAMMADTFLADPELERRRLRLIRGNSAVRALNLQQTDEWGRAIAVQAARRLGQDPRDALPILLGTCTIAALRTAIDRWLEAPDADYRAELARCFALLADLGAATSLSATSLSATSLSGKSRSGGSARPSGNTR